MQCNADKGGRKRVVKEAGKLPLGRAEDAHSPISDLWQSQASHRTLTFCFSSCFNCHDISCSYQGQFSPALYKYGRCHLASTRVETGTSRAIKAGFSAAWGGKPGQQLGAITDQYPLQIGHRCGHVTTGQGVTQTHNVDKLCLKCLQPQLATGRARAGQAEDCSEGEKWVSNFLESEIRAWKLIWTLLKKSNQPAYLLTDS